MQSLPEKQLDHTRIVAFLAHESHAAMDDVSKLYERERAELAMGAHVTKFLDIFAMRNVQAILHKREAERLAVRMGAERQLLSK